MDWVKKLFAPALNYGVRLAWNRDVDLRICRLKQVSEITSTAEVIRKALCTYDCILQEKVKGARVLLQYEDGRICELVVE